MKTDRCRSRSDINNLHYEMTIDFTKRMRQIKNGFAYSKPIMQALDYISDHLHSRIFIEELAEYLSLSVPYLSRLFKSELGMPFSQYIIIKKVEAAASMLQFSDYSALDISNYFAFSSHSYFIKVFKNHIGMTPKEYRNKYYAIGWMNNKIAR
jgi:AraC family transcriptional regulator